MINEPAAARAALESLLKVLRTDVDPCDGHDFLLRLSDIEIVLKSVEAMAADRRQDGVRRRIVSLRSIEIGCDIAGLSVDLLAWYALAADPQGNNEPTIGGERARQLRKRCREQLSIDGAELLRLRDELAAALPTLAQESA